MTFKTFIADYATAVEDICREYFNQNRERIKIKKEAVAVKNLSIIVNSTLKLSNEKGFNAMSLRDLSADSGLSMGALYSYFASKDELLLLIQKHGQLTMKRILRDELEKCGTVREKLHAMVKTHLYLSEAMQYWFYFLFMETKNFSKESRTFSIDSELLTEGMIIDILKEGIDQDIFTDIDTRLTASVIKAMMQDWYLKRWKYKRRNISVDEYADYLISFIETYLRRQT
ncbi:MAG: TetR/AcrR family transcriptional regulator [Spirochaetae bacterium HGW-Spirochaetae-1]|jgi:AcrR family transcriptional regulator|nr:MAG: TetR/AcrR family transcriptional regulator [Spirochaetae bacterium HGW-Spirochaetae-1]